MRELPQEEAQGDAAAEGCAGRIDEVARSRCNNSTAHLAQTGSTKDARVQTDGGACGSSIGDPSGISERDQGLCRESNGLEGCPCPTEDGPNSGEGYNGSCAGEEARQ